ncbi:twin-arginine translocase TatA/TatE family subunit [Pedobacter fastidiosus]|uniref:Sec-independent protein translocase protein TatA n=1 Tax=Pedobacter fastidiosus TaxID=2765361 RepID=A0ABR7KRQ8_9SPHI|nr:twin-arginine translocase TatA/TatE family subunit [Pedobacter fastidiosus]MBC6110766.1 twin-arginine translocase TatA/TatE family subunit [Pedobacter fastidiosus]
MLNATTAAILGGPELIIVGVAILLLFGGKKIPELMKGLGKGIKEFKNGQEGTDEHVVVQKEAKI